MGGRGLGLTVGAVGNCWMQSLIVVEWRGVLDARLPTSACARDRGIPTRAVEGELARHTPSILEGASCDSTGFCGAGRQDMAGKTISRLLRQLTLR